MGKARAAGARTRPARRGLPPRARQSPQTWRWALSSRRRQRALAARRSGRCRAAAPSPGSRRRREPRASRTEAPASRRAPGQSAPSVRAFVRLSARQRGRAAGAAPDGAGGRAAKAARGDGGPPARHLAHDPAFAGGRCGVRRRDQISDNDRGSARAWRSRREARGARGARTGERARRIVSLFAKRRWVPALGVRSPGPSAKRRGAGGRRAVAQASVVLRIFFARRLAGTDRAEGRWSGGPTMARRAKKNAPRDGSASRRAFRWRGGGGRGATTHRRTFLFFLSCRTAYRSVRDGVGSAPRAAGPREGRGVCATGSSLHGAARVRNATRYASAPSIAALVRVGRPQLSPRASRRATVQAREDRGAVQKCAAGGGSLRKQAAGIRSNRVLRRNKKCTRRCRSCRRGAAASPRPASVRPAR